MGTIVIYGKPRTRKTRFGTPPNSVYLDIEKGSGSIQDRPYTPLDCTSFSDLSHILNQIENNPNNRAVITIDSMTELCELELERQRIKNKDARQAYMTVQNEAMGLIRRMKAITNAEFIIIMWALLLKDELTGEFMVSPVLTGEKLSQKFPHHVDAILYMETKPDPFNPTGGSVSKVIAESTSNIVCGDRLFRFPPETVLEPHQTIADFITL